MLVSEVFLVVRDTPFSVDRPPSADDACQAVRRVRHKREQKTRVDGEVVDPLLGLFDERVAEDLPSKILSNAAHLTNEPKLGESEVSD